MDGYSSMNQDGPATRANAERDAARSAAARLNLKDEPLQAALKAIRNLGNTVASDATTRHRRLEALTAEVLKWCRWGMAYWLDTKARAALSAMQEALRHPSEERPEAPDASSAEEHG